MDIVSHNRHPWVLVVDDHDLSRHFTVQALRQITDHVKQARNGREGIELAARFRPEMIFLDVHLPDTDGFSVLRQIRTSWPDDTPEPGFVIVSGDSSINGDEVGAICTITKPARSRDIKDLATRHLSPFRRVEEAKDSSRVLLPSLRNIFLDDLEKQCPMLDQHISALDWRSAREVLHQLIAASAICQEADIEFYCRLMSQELADSCHPKKLSCAYFGLLRAIDQFRQSSQDW